MIVEEFEGDADLSAIKLPWRSVVQSAAMSPSLTTESCCSEIQERRVRGGLVSSNAVCRHSRKATEVSLSRILRFVLSSGLAVYSIACVALGMQDQGDRELPQ